MAFAAREARALKHEGVGTEHLLLGLLIEGQGVAALVLRSLGVSLEAARAAILRETGGAGGEPTTAS
jgi:ATP-dependent Clp protease ATP-binding subunit ClpC